MDMKGQIKSFQHYVPRFLLNYFTTGSLLEIYDRQIKEFRKQSPNRTAGEKAYYIFLDKKGKHNDALEKMFTAIEGHAAPIVKQLHGGKTTLTPQEKADLGMFIAALYLRGPDYHRRIGDMSEQLSTETMSRSAMFEPYFQRSMDRFEKKHGAKIPPEERKKIQKMIAEKQYDLKFPKEHWLKMMMLSLTDTYNIISQMEWAIFKPPKDKAFITSDNPAYTFNVKPEGFWGSGIGFLAPNCESTAILTPKVAIFLSQKHNPSVVRFVDISNDLVKNINFRTAICSTRFVVSNSDTLLKRTIERTHLDKRGPYARVKVD